MHKIIIDENYKEYHPLINLSEIDLFEINLKKYNVLYIYIDSMKTFYKKYKSFSSNCIFLINKNVVFNCENVFIEYKNYSVDKEYSFRAKILHYNFIKDFLGGKK